MVYVVECNIVSETAPGVPVTLRGWISKWGYTTASNRQAARTFKRRKHAESFALLLTIKCPHYIGKLSVVPWYRRRVI